MADYYSDNIRPTHGEKYYDPYSMDIKIYDGVTGKWWTMTMDDKLPPPPLAVSGVHIPGLTHSKAASGMMETKLWPGTTPTKPLPPAPPKPKPITDFDFDEEDFEL